MDNLPKHIAVIPDGNRRWAKKRNLPAFMGHRYGTKAVEEVLKETLKLKIPYLTFWLLSRDNIQKRAKTEVNFLFNLFYEYFKKLLSREEVYKNQIRINVIGQWEDLFPEKLKKMTKEIIKKTENFSRHQLTLLMGYNGIDEMLQAVEKIADSGKAELSSGRHDPKLKITPELIKRNLWTKTLPPVDLVIRTGGEPHWSNGFMMWDTADAQFYFTEILWPDFNEKEFEKAIKEFSGRERRGGA